MSSTVRAHTPYMHYMYIAEHMQLVRTKCRFTDEEVGRLVGYAIEISWATPARKRELDAMRRATRQ